LYKKEKPKPFSYVEGVGYRRMAEGWDKCVEYEDKRIRCFDRVPTEEKILAVGRVDKLKGQDGVTFTAKYVGDVDATTKHEINVSEPGLWLLLFGYPGYLLIRFIIWAINIPDPLPST